MDVEEAMKIKENLVSQGIERNRILTIFNE